MYKIFKSYFYIVYLHFHTPAAVLPPSINSGHWIKIQIELGRVELAYFLHHLNLICPEH